MEKQVEVEVIQNIKSMVKHIEEMFGFFHEPENELVFEGEVSMSRKRKWVKEYRCGLFGMHILNRVSFCKEPGREDKKCLKCKYRGNEDKLVGLSGEYIAHICEQQE